MQAGAHEKIIRERVPAGACVIQDRLKKAASSLAGSIPVGIARAPCCGQRSERGMHRRILRS